MKIPGKITANKILHKMGVGISIGRSHRHQFDDTFERLAHVKSLGFTPDNICDIGASNGRWTQECMKIFPASNYFLVDPLDTNEPFLKEFAAKEKTVRYWKGCLGASKGFCTLNVDGDGSSVLGGHTGNSYGASKVVAMEMLDNLIESGFAVPPNLIKIDVQGYELEVLKGAQNALTTTEAIILEISFFPFQENMPVFHEVIGKLAEYGFIVYDILALNMRPLDYAAGQTDILFLKSNHNLIKNNHWSSDSIY